MLVISIRSQTLLLVCFSLLKATNLYSSESEIREKSPTSIADPSSIADPRVLEALSKRIEAIRPKTPTRKLKRISKELEQVGPNNLFNSTKNPFAPQALMAGAYLDCIGEVDDDYSKYLIESLHYPYLGRLLIDALKIYPTEIKFTDLARKQEYGICSSSHPRIIVSLRHGEEADRLSLVHELTHHLIYRLQGVFDDLITPGHLGAKVTVAKAYLKDISTLRREISDAPLRKRSLHILKNFREQKQMLARLQDILNYTGAKSIKISSSKKVQEEVLAETIAMFATKTTPRKQSKNLFLIYKIFITRLKAHIHHNTPKKTVL